MMYSNLIRPLFTCALSLCVLYVCSSLLYLTCTVAYKFNIVIEVVTTKYTVELCAAVLETVLGSQSRSQHVI